MKSSILKTLFMSLLLITLSVLPLYAAELGGQLKLTEDKQELKEVMKQIRKLLPNDVVMHSDPNSKWFDKTSISINECSIKSRTHTGTGEESGGYTGEINKYEIRLSDIGNNIITATSGYEGYSNVVITTKDEDDTIIHIREPLGHPEYNSTTYGSSYAFTIDTNNAERFQQLIKKAIELCAER